MPLHNLFFDFVQKPKISTSLIRNLKKICGEEGVSLRENHRIAYGRDCSTASLIEIREGKVAHRPDLIAWPRSTEEVARVLKLAHEHQIPLVPYGAGSGVCGGAVPLRGGIVLDLKKMDRLLSVDPNALTVTAETGILGEILERKLKTLYLTLGHFPSSIYTATLGGYLACRSAGQLSTKYGKIEEMVKGLTVCTADGRILRLGLTSGFDLKELFLGSEGTLGVITEATLKVHPQPEDRHYFAFRFPDLTRGLQAIRIFMQKGYRPAVVRLYDPLDSLMFAASGNGGSESLWEKGIGEIPAFVGNFFKGVKKEGLKLLLARSAWLNRVIDHSLSKVLLILGFEGAAWKVRFESKKVAALCEREGGENLGEELGLQWLKNRYNISYKMSPLIDGGCFADTMEVAASWDRLETLYESVREALREKVLVMAHFSHAYPEGCSIYFTFVGYASSEEKSLALHREVWKEGLSKVLEAGGTTSHHHGIGFLKTEAFVEELGPLHDWLKKVKSGLDPRGMMNPGKMGL